MKADSGMEVDPRIEAKKFQTFVQILAGNYPRPAHNIFGQWRTSHALQPQSRYPEMPE
jgi:hypothetical protein